MNHVHGPRDLVTRNYTLKALKSIGRTRVVLRRVVMARGTNTNNIKCLVEVFLLQYALGWSFMQSEGKS